MEIQLPLDEHILADGNILLLEKTVKHQGVWVVHLSDADPWPSNPHAERQDEPGKLDLFTGDVYDPQTRRRMQKLSAKSMKYIYGQIMAHEYKDIKNRLLENKTNIKYL